MEHTLNRQTTTILTYTRTHKSGTTACGAFPVFPARPPRRRARARVRAWGEKTRNPPGARGGSTGGNRIV